MKKTLKLILKADEPNVNGLIFTKKAIEKAIKNYKENQIKKNRSYGSIGYCTKTAEFDLNKAAFRVKDIKKIRGKNEYEAEISTMRNDEGKKLIEEIEKMGDDARVGFMMYGDVDKKDTINDFTIAYSALLKNPTKQGNI